MEESRLSILVVARSVDASLFPLRLHPLHAALQEQMFEWTKAEFGYVQLEAKMKKINSRNYGWLACSFWFKSVSPQCSLTLLKLMFWFSVFNNAINNTISMSWDAAAAHDYCYYVLETLFGNASGKELASTIASRMSLGSDNVKTRYKERELLPIILAMEWWGEMKSDNMPIKQQTRFATAIMDYVMSQVTIIHFNELMDVKAPPHVHDFIPVRRVAIGTPLCFLSSEYDLDIDLDEDPWQPLHATIA
ncbi:hypothetical protein GOP47_0003581 [Adiantum capillus-veneris]|uniref:Uncharacterized protein n=1 Tax=Adiantum capillus-veneris TaxID=13818 RepID=A0A9D4V677_ADICA|nr:hypothetical protein GOP47_0003581 [Adiantum capillus-veneris]